MIAPNTQCIVIEIPVTQGIGREDLNAGPIDLLPWADPYITRLVEKHRQAVESRLSEGGLRGEAPPPLLSPDLDFTREDREGRSPGEHAT